MPPLLPVHALLALVLLDPAGLAAAGQTGGAAPAAAAFSMPPEWEPHEAMWLGWSDESAHHPVQLEIIRALMPTVQVRLLVTGDATEAEARAALVAAGLDAAQVQVFHHPVRNAWIRDAGPIFLRDGTRLAVADFAWNWYGYPAEMTSRWTSRDPIDRDLAARLSLPAVRSSLVAEGGAFDFSTDVILSYRETALQRNPGVALADIEAEYLRVFGKRKMVWLDRAPLADRVVAGPKIANYVGWGANGHVDEYVRFVDDATIVIARVDPEDRDEDPLTQADAVILDENLAQLEAARDAQGRPFRIVTLPTPSLRYHVESRAVTEEDKRGDLGRVVLREFAVGAEVHFVPALSYLNFVLSNGVVLVARYGRDGLPARELAKDEEARATLARLFPDRRIVQIDALALNRDGGGMHCQTQQQPRPR